MSCLQTGMHLSCIFVEINKWPSFCTSSIIFDFPNQGALKRHYIEDRYRQMNLKGNRICDECLLDLGNIIENIYLFFFIFLNVFISEIADELVYSLFYKTQVHPHFKICLRSSLNCVVDFQGSSVTAGLKRLSVQTAERVVVSRQTLLLLLLRIIKKIGKKSMVALFVKELA